VCAQPNSTPSSQSASNRAAAAASRRASGTIPTGYEEERWNTQAIPALVGRLDSSEASIDLLYRKVGDRGTQTRSPRLVCHCRYKGRIQIPWHGLPVFTAVVDHDQMLESTRAFRRFLRSVGHRRANGSVRADCEKQPADRKAVGTDFPE
jgi:hypothetical protein